MNKADLIEALAPRLGGRSAAGAAVETFVDVVLREVANGGSVGITGFGTFEKVDRAPRTGRNPRTGEAVPIAGTSTPRFRPGSYFKDVVGDPSTLPTEGLAGVRGGGAAESAQEASEGTPASVRRSGGSSAGRRGSRSAATTPARSSTPQKAVSTGTPSTVRKTAAERGRDDGNAAATQAPAAATSGKAATTKTSEPAKAKDPSGGRMLAGGEDITAGMINAKKAQLAKVKNDEKAKKDKKKSGKKDKKKSKKK